MCACMLAHRPTCVCICIIPVATSKERILELFPNYYMVSELGKRQRSLLEVFHGESAACGEVPRRREQGLVQVADVAYGCLKSEASAAAAGGWCMSGQEKSLRD